jgi:hypothetical protein
VKSVYDILKEVADTSSKNEKLAILTEHKDNINLKSTIRLTYDPFTNFYIRKIPDYITKNEKPLSWGLLGLSGLSDRFYTGNDAIEYLSNLLGQLSEKDADVLARVVSRDLRCGFSESTANKVWPGLIMEYPCMLCSTMDDKLLAKMPFPAYFQMKLDGMRFNAIVKDGKVEYRSRNGKLLELFGILDDIFLKMGIELYDLDLVFDGELLIFGDDYKPLPRQIGNGILQRAAKGKGTKKDVEMVACVLWDVIPYESFFKGKNIERYDKRFESLQKAIESVQSPRVTLVDNHPVKNMDQVQVLYKEYLASGQEGGILKDVSAPWEDGRSRRQIKLKAELEADLLCVGFEKGTGKNANRLGALVLESKDGIIKVSVGSGFTDLDRDTFTEENTVGKIVTVKYNTRIKDSKTGQESLFLPIYIELRTMDKDEADSSKDIK